MLDLVAAYSINQSDHSRQKANDLAILITLFMFAFELYKKYIMNVHTQIAVKRSILCSILSVTLLNELFEREMSLWNTRERRSGQRTIDETQFSRAITSTEFEFVDSRGVNQSEGYGARFS